MKFAKNCKHGLQKQQSSIFIIVFALLFLLFILLLLSLLSLSYIFRITQPLSKKVTQLKESNKKRTHSGTFFGQNVIILLSSTSSSTIQQYINIRWQKMLWTTLINVMKGYEYTTTIDYNDFLTCLFCIEGTHRHRRIQISVCMMKFHYSFIINNTYPVSKRTIVKRG
jgi:hypothetical protein